MYLVLPVLTFLFAILGLAQASTFQTLEEYFTLEINSSASNMSDHVGKDVTIKNNMLTIEASAKQISNVSAYSSINIHSMDQGSHRLSIGARANGLIELLLCHTRRSKELPPRQEVANIFVELYYKLDKLIKEHPGFILFIEDHYECEGVMLAPDSLSDLKKLLEPQFKSVLQHFSKRIPSVFTDNIWENRFNLEIGADNSTLQAISLFCELPTNKGLKFGIEGLEKLRFKFLNKVAVLEIVANMTDPAKELLIIGDFPFTPLSYYSQEQIFTENGLHPKLTRRFAIKVNSKEIYARLKNDQSCIVLVQETLDKDNYIDIDEVKYDGNMTFHTFGVIDIERPSSHSPQHTYFIQFFMNSSYISHDDSHDILWINYTTPFHFRYQPAGDKEYTSVDVWEASQMYLSCKEYDSYKMDEYNRMESGYIDLLEEKFNRRFLVVPNILSNNFIIGTYDVPTGLLEHRDMAIYVSLGIATAFCAVLVWHIMRQKSITFEGEKTKSKSGTKPKSE